MKMSKKVLLFTVAALAASNYDVFAMKRHADGDAHDGGEKRSRTGAAAAPEAPLDPIAPVAPASPVAVNQVVP